MSLTSPPPQPSAGEAAIQHLLRAIRSPLTEKSPNSFPAITKTGHSFFSGSKPRDRRGRIGDKLRVVSDALLFDEENIDGAETPTVRGPSRSRSEYVEVDHERDREFLESLRSAGLVRTYWIRCAEIVTGVLRSTATTEAVPGDGVSAIGEMTLMLPGSIRPSKTMMSIWIDMLISCLE
jgi:hypothetical protein